MLRLLLLFSCVTGMLFGELENHLKPVPNKSGIHRIRNIDFIYMINLDRRPEKLKSSMAQLAPYNIIPCRFPAVNGWELSLEEINDVGAPYESWMATGIWGTRYPLDKGGEPEHEIMGTPGNIYFCHCMAQGSIGCVLSHCSVLQDALNSGYETIWVLEDDIEVIQDPHLLSTRIEELDAIVGENGWDVLFTDADTKSSLGQYVPCSSYAKRPNYSPVDPYRFSVKTEVGPLFRQVGARYGSYSMILRRSGIKKILNFLKCYQVFLPYDMEYTQPPNIRLFVVKEDIISTQPGALSDNGGRNYLLTVEGT